MNEITRKKMVVCMEFIARAINDEDVFEGWLMGGVADGDIKNGSLDLSEVDEYYIRDDNFRDLMDCFLRRMARAQKIGGLYIDEIATKEGDWNV